MSPDIQFFANAISDLGTVGFMVLGTFRSVQMERAFVDRVYKSKALWSAALMVSILLSTVSTLVPIPTTGFWSLIGALPLLLVVVVSYAFVDRTILVAVRSDFFHRNVIGWMKFRVPGYFLVFAGALAGILAGTLVSNASATPLWATLASDAFIIVVPLTLGYAAVAVVVSARRTADRTLKRHILLLGISLACFAAILALFAAPTTDFFVLLTDALNVASLYVLYRAVMKLTSLGRVPRDIGQASPGVPVPAVHGQGPR
jgi:hypothetical protein